MRIDLHNHSTYSDGVLAPEALVKRAKENGVDIFALTDHDSVFGCEEIVEYGEKLGVRVIKGLELSTVYKNESVHIVCLFKNNIVPKEMVEFSNNLRDRRIKRAIDMMEKIRDIYGLKIDLDKLFEKTTIVTRSNMLKNICDCNNMTRQEASFYVSNESKAFIHSTKMTVEEGLELARRANTVAILAHPCLLPEEYVEEILQYGFDGIEARYANVKNDEEKFIRLANKYHLMVSAGSDCHGDNSHADIGTATLNENEFKPIADALNFKI